MAKTHAVGIDLGTTLSAVAYVNETGQTAMLRNAEGEILTPSVVYFKGNQVIVGREARAALGDAPYDIAQCVKRDMGKRTISRPVHGEYFPPEVLQACILRKLKDDARSALGDDFKVVITVPAFFDELRRKTTADAGEMAGLEVLDIVNEPTAAALAYGEHLGYLTVAGAPREEMKVLVYDLGGGTFDVTLIHLRPGDLRTLATDGDVRLGGADWDQRLADYAAEAFLGRYGEDPRQDPHSCARLYLAAEQAKHQLSIRGQTKIVVELFGRTLEVPVTREQFEEMTEDLLERTAYTTRQVLQEARLGWDDISRVLLVGGSTRMPMVVRMLEQLSGITPDHSVNPDEAVARGAAIYAGYLLASRGSGGRRPRFQVVDVNSHSLGIEGIDQRTGRKENIILIPRNTPLPARVMNRFVTKMEDQRSIVIKVLEGESPDAEACITIGKAVLRDLPPGLKKGHPVEVAYRYGTNGRLDVRARVPGTNREVAMELQRDSGLSDDRVGLWRQVITSHAGFTAFEEMLEDVLDVKGIVEGEEVPAAAAGTVAPAALGEAPDPVRWAGQPAGDAAAAARRPLRAVPASPPMTSAEPTAGGTAAPLGRPQTPAPSAAAPEPILANLPRRGASGRWMHLAGHVIAGAIGLAIGALILYWLGIRLW